MGRKKTGALPVNKPEKEKKMVIDMTEVSLRKAYQNPGFRTGGHMSEKDRPRKKNWKKDYCESRDSGSFLWWSIRGSNPWPQDCEPCALPAELMPQGIFSHLLYSENRKHSCTLYAACMVE